MYTSRGVPLNASTKCCGENLSNEITQRQRTQYLWRYHSTAIDIDIGGFGKKFYLRRTALGQDQPQSRAFTLSEGLESQTLQHTCRDFSESHRDLERVPFCGH